MKVSTDWKYCDLSKTVSQDSSGLVITCGDDETSSEHCETMAEALTILDETGLTPRQLAEQRAELLGALKVMTGLCQIKYGNLDADVWSEIQKARAILEKCK